MRKQTAVKFGQSLDNDEFELTKQLLSQDCKYVIGKETLIGPDNICNSYEQNMLEGRKKLDSLEWGKSHIESINETEFYVHFTDFLRHKGKDYVHRCKQKLVVDDHGLISSIEHIHDQEEQDRLDQYYVAVGLK